MNLLLSGRISTGRRRRRVRDGAAAAGLLFGVLLLGGCGRGLEPDLVELSVELHRDGSGTIVENEYRSTAENKSLTEEEKAVVRATVEADKDKPEVRHTVTEHDWRIERRWEFASLAGFEHERIQMDLEAGEPRLLGLGTTQHRLSVRYSPAMLRETAERTGELERISEGIVAELEPKLGSPPAAGSRARVAAFLLMTGYRPEAATSEQVETGRFSCSLIVPGEVVAARPLTLGPLAVEGVGKGTKAAWNTHLLLIDGAEAGVRFKGGPPITFVVEFTGELDVPGGRSVLVPPAAPAGGSGAKPPPAAATTTGAGKGPRTDRP